MCWYHADRQVIDILLGIVFGISDYQSRQSNTVGVTYTSRRCVWLYSISDHHYSSASAPGEFSRGWGS